MIEKTILKNVDVTIKLEETSIGYAVYLFIGDELFLSRYGNEKEMRENYNETKKFLGVIQRKNIKRD